MLSGTASDKHLWRPQAASWCSCEQRPLWVHCFCARGSPSHQPPDSLRPPPCSETPLPLLTATFLKGCGGNKPHCLRFLKVNVLQIEPRKADVDYAEFFGSDKRLVQEAVLPLYTTVQALVVQTQYLYCTHGIRSKLPSNTL